MIPKRITRRPLGAEAATGRIWSREPRSHRLNGYIAFRFHTPIRSGAHAACRARRANRTRGATWPSVIETRLLVALADQPSQPLLDRGHNGHRSRVQESRIELVHGHRSVLPDVPTRVASAYRG